MANYEAQIEPSDRPWQGQDSESGSPFPSESVPTDSSTDSSEESEDVDLSDPDDVSSGEVSIARSDSTGPFEDIMFQGDELHPTTFLRTAKSGCPVCGNLDNRNWGWIADVLVTTFEILTKASMNCSTCSIIFGGISTHLDLEPDARLEFCCSEGGSFFALHPPQVRSVDYGVSDGEEYGLNSDTTSSDKADSDKLNGDETVDENESEYIHSQDGQSQDDRGEEYNQYHESEGSEGISEDSIDFFDSGPSEAIEFYVEPGFTGPGPAVGPARSLPTNFTLQDATLISEWLEDCERNHAACKQPTPSLPTRVLFVGSDDRLPYIYESRNEEARYIALSHCWGAEEHRPPTTTNETLAQRKKGIDWSELPPTFVDAIAVTRLLGIDYLWIDSLCIIQDDVDDWAKESAKMVDVYQHAVLTISADGAVNSQTGLFHTVSQRATAKPKRMSWTDGSQENVLYTRLTSLPVKSVRIHSVATSDMGDNPLRGRAWTLQEWLVSPRVVHFTKGELVWECKQVHRCECQMTFKKRSPIWSSKTKTHFIWFNKEEKRTDVNWYMVANEFTKRLITRGIDRLPALSGIAALAKPNAISDYVAGIWESDLPLSLLWARVGQESMRHQEYYAPTWSWASLIGPEIRLERRLSPLAKIISLSKELSSANPFGSLKTASIKIKGPMARFPSHVNWNGEARIFFTDVSNGYRGKLTLDVTKPFEIKTLDELVVVFIGYFRKEFDEDRAFVEGLALRRAEQAEGCFQRVGVVKISFKDSVYWRHVLSHVLRARNKTVTIV